jgi:hypothetical protein
MGGSNLEDHGRYIVRSEQVSSLTYLEWMNEWMNKWMLYELEELSLRSKLKRHTITAMQIVSLHK